ncbi:MAG: MIP family channel protein [Actinobacteria bacterium]|nr:MIP family channel protein [Actinomycetota bacterium]
MRRCVAEFVGAFALIFIGAGSIIELVRVPSIGLVGVALAHGLAIAVMVSALGHISGGHFNPAVTFGFLITRRMQPALAVSYWVSQFAGALVAALLLKGIFPSADVDQVKLGAPALGGIGAGAGLVLEMILTFFLVWVVFATAADPRGTFKAIAGLAIGLTISMDILCAGPLTGAAMNPARAFGPQLVQNAWSDGWIWYLGPIAGAAAAALLYEWLYLKRLGPEPVGPPETGLEEPRPGQTAADV